MRKLLIITILLCLVGCRGRNNSSNIGTIKETNFQYEIHFPDTVYVNKLYDGEITYQSPFDTIIEKFFDPKKKRYVVFRTLPNKSYSFHNDFLRDSLNEYRIGAIDNRSIPFYDLSFSTTGVFEINGLVNDQVLIEPKTKHNRDEFNFRLIEHDFPISLKVVVIDSLK